MTVFAAGHRVVVTGIRPDGVAPTHPERLVGHFGHVREVLGQWVLVDITGRVGGDPYRKAIEFELGWAFHRDELEHAD